MHHWFGCKYISNTWKGIYYIIIKLNSHGMHNITCNLKKMLFEKLYCVRAHACVWWKQSMLAGGLSETDRRFRGAYCHHYG